MKLSLVRVFGGNVDFVEVLGQISQDTKMLEAFHVLFLQTLEFFL
jgi:hypothetical protein|tara:strand:+ start:146 stop:280 length:135 start_codon:yes stop_codon:yes gene_type:complete